MPGWWLVGWNLSFLVPLRKSERQHGTCWSVFAQGELEGFETLFRQLQGEVFDWIRLIIC